MTLPVPPLPLQRVIADYLDRETARLDALVEAKERLLGLLAEKRRSLITRAVTHGLDPHVGLRDCGMHWLGQIPAHWEVVALKFTCQSIQCGPFGSQLHAGDYVDGGIPLVNPAHIVHGRIVPDGRVSVNEDTAQALAVHRLLPGDIVFARRGELGRCALVTQRERGWLCGTGSLRVRPKEALILPGFLILAIGDTSIGDCLSVKSVGSTMENLNTEIVGNMPIPVPPMEEQHSIVAHVCAEATKMDALRKATERTIALLKERRAALIAAAVTGQVDVLGEERQVDTMAKSEKRVMI